MLPFLSCFRRLSLGIDIQSHAVYAVILSRRYVLSMRSSSVAIRLEYAGHASLPVGAATETTQALTKTVTIFAKAIVKALSLAPSSCRQALNTTVMALPDDAIVLHECSINRLSGQAMPMQINDELLTALTPAVYAEGERLLGLESSAIAADWFRPEPEQAPDRLILAISPRSYLDERISMAAQAGLMLHAIDGETACAQRADRFIKAYALSKTLLNTLEMGDEETKNSRWAIAFGSSLRGILE
jgi:Tfp pilus assembly PilM family ATPase